MSTQLTPAFRQSWEDVLEATDALVSAIPARAIPDVADELRTLQQALRAQSRVLLAEAEAIGNGGARHDA